MTWAELFERAAECEATEAAVTERLAARRGGGPDGGGGAGEGP